MVNWNGLMLLVGLYLVMGLFEIKFPAERGQHLSGRARNIAIAVILNVVGAFFLGLIYFLAPFEFRDLPNRGLAVSSAILVIYIFLTDLIFYWYHRAEHHFELLWPIHELHHSDAELNSTTGLRTYWLERPLQTLFIAIPINFLVGMDPVAAPLLPVVLTVWLFFTHANLKLRLGPLTPVITGPQLHRIHHSNLPEHQGKNFAQFFPAIDLLFGTYYRPGRDEFPTTGVPELPSDASIPLTLARPWKIWFGRIAKSLKH